MKFKTLEEKCLYYRELADYKLLPGLPIIIFLDGRSFSKKIKPKFDLPFSDIFVRIMDETLAWVCKNIQGCRFGYCQSDEMSVVVVDKDEEGDPGSSFFCYRLCKIQSIVASIATSKFNQLMMSEWLKVEGNTVEGMELYEFDCRAWTVPGDNDIYSWFLYRQNDCIRNSKQQVAQTYLKHKELLGLNTDEQLEKLRIEKGIDYDKDFPANVKCGRVCYREEVVLESIEYGEYKRNRWGIHDAPYFREDT